MTDDKTAFQETYLRAAAAVAVVCVVTAEGDEGNGSAFHIGDGVFVTARHVIDGLTITEVAITKSIHLGAESGGGRITPRRFLIIDGPYFADDLDVAVFKVDLGDTPLPILTISQHTDFTLDENDYILSNVLIIGYPPIYGTIEPVQVTTLGQINAVVRLRGTPAAHFVASSMARGGFSGGPALDHSGTVIGLVTQSQTGWNMPPELGFMSILSIEPALDLAAEKFGVSAGGDVPGRYSDTLFGANFIRMVERPLSSFVYDATVMVYDDDHDIFAELKCVDEPLLNEMVASFHAVTPIERIDVDSGEVLYIPINNPPAAVLLRAGEAVAELLTERGYRMMPAERSQWQLKAAAPASAADANSPNPKA